MGLIFLEGFKAKNKRAITIKKAMKYFMAFGYSPHTQSSIWHTPSGLLCL
jgi:hypothetical protein